MLNPELLARPRRRVSSRTGCAAALPAGFERFSSLAKAQYVEIATFFEGYLLHTQGDRMLMAHSIEGRFPFVD